jgi:hypothetical protein
MLTSSSLQDVAFETAVFDLILASLRGLWCRSYRREVANTLLPFFTGVTCHTGEELSQQQLHYLTVCAHFALQLQYMSTVHLAGVESNKYACVCVRA